MDEVELLLLQQFSHHTGQQLEESVIFFPPNCIPALLHWRTLAAIIGSLPIERAEVIRQASKDLSLPVVTEFQYLQYLVIDDHCHLGKVLQKN